MTQQIATESKYMWFLNRSGIMYKEYQREGVEWCVNLETHNNPELPIRGGFIADEMGLGKTIMMIATFACNYLPHTLIVLPNILMEQWAQEIFRTTKHQVLIYHGKDKKNITMAQLEAAPIVLTTYSAISLNTSGLLFAIEWNRVVFDEAHHLRNDTQRNTGARLLKSGIKWFISGTPIQNKKKDFYNLCSALNMPASYYSEPKNLPHLIQHFVLRRTKKQVGIEIPDVVFNERLIDWDTEEEKKLADDIHKASKHASRDFRLKLYTQARQSCILPALLIGKTEEMVKYGIYPRVNPETLNKCSKMDVVISTILSRKDNGNGKLIFCHYKGEIDAIYNRLSENGITRICIFDGRTNQMERARKIKMAFDVVILQIQTGCEGLNLQEHFSEIYFVSPNWNPFVEKQAVARCHRIGQKKEVSVFSFQMTDFVDYFDQEDDPIPGTVEEEELVGYEEGIEKKPSMTSSLDNYISIVKNGKIRLVEEIMPTT